MGDTVQVYFDFDFHCINQISIVLDRNHEMKLFWGLGLLRNHCILLNPDQRNADACRKGNLQRWDRRYQYKWTTIYAIQAYNLPYIGMEWIAVSLKEPLLRFKMDLTESFPEPLTVWRWIDL